MKTRLVALFALWFLGCAEQDNTVSEYPDVFLVVLGIAQDAGYPQANCTKSCCNKVWKGEVKREKVVSLGLVDRSNNKVFLFEATPDFKGQLHDLLSYLPNGDFNSVGGIFLTHAHIGHYTGLMHLGHEAIGANNVPVYAMPKMQSYLTSNGPWSQLVSFNNINLIPLQDDSIVNLSDNISVTPFLVPHRDEYSETVGYNIVANGKKMMFIPDIDKWYKWDRDIKEEVEKVDFAFLDATFYDIEELPGRDMSKIGHPFVLETIETFKGSPESLKNKIVLIHFNHTNPLLRDDEESHLVQKKGFVIAREGDLYNLE